MSPLDHDVSRSSAPAFLSIPDTSPTLDLPTTQRAISPPSNTTIAAQAPASSALSVRTMPQGPISSTAKAIYTPEIVSEFLGHLTPTVDQARRAYLFSGDSDVNSRDFADAVSETRLSQRTLVSVAQVSRFLCGLALDALWANLGTLRPVDSLLEGSGLQPGTSIIDEPTLARFDIYARKIKFLIASADELSPILWRRLSSLRQRQGPLFPRLHSLEMDNISCAEAKFTFAVLGPSITRLSLACDADIVDVPYHLDEFYYISQMTKDMVKFSPNVKNLFLGLPPLQKPDPPVLLPLATLGNLKYLSLGSTLVDSVVLDELSKMKTLKQLECGASSREEPDGPLSTSSGFESLTSLRIIGSPVDLTAFIDDLRGAPIRRLRLVIIPPPSCEFDEVGRCLDRVSAKFSSTLKELAVFCDHTFEHHAMPLDLVLLSLHPLKAAKRIEIDFPRQLFTLSNDTLLNALTSWASLATFSLTFNDSYPVPQNPEKRLDHVVLFEVACQCPEIVNLTLSGVNCSAVGRSPLDPKLYASLPTAGHGLERLVLLNLRNTNVLPLARMLSQIFPRLDSSPPPGMKPEWYMDNLIWGMVMSALHMVGSNGPQ